MKDFIKNFENFKIAYDDIEQPLNFHDAEIVSITLDRSNQQTISVKMNTRVKYLGNYIENEVELVKWRKAEFELLFKEARLEKLRDFNHQNVINDLIITQIEESDTYNVWFDSCFGCELKFDCKEIELIEVKVSEIVSERFRSSEETLKKVRSLRKKLKFENSNSK